jgi:prolyl-tRNA synthetase
LDSTKLLEEKGVGYRLIELKEKAFSVADVIRYAKEPLDPDEICKTMILKDEKGNKYAVMLLGYHRIDFAKAKGFLCSALSIASSEEVKEATGIEPGAVCPILLRIPLFVDRRVLEKEKINFGSGDHLYGLEVHTRDLEKIANFRVVDVAQT